MHSEAEVKPQRRGHEQGQLGKQRPHPAWRHKTRRLAGAPWTGVGSGRAAHFRAEEFRLKWGRE